MRSPSELRNPTSYLYEQNRYYDDNNAISTSSRYSTQPGAFTILPPDDCEPPPEPPVAPQPYRLTPSARRHKNLSFAILPEPCNSRSRSPSPSGGRVSPFRGRGFNPTGSRHASPIPSPTPPEDITPTTPHYQRQSKIPKLTRRGSASAFGEKIAQSPNRRKLNNQLSQSLTNISRKPPPSPRRQQQLNLSRRRSGGFQRLSPIVGSSPEPSQSQSSPIRYTASQPQSPNRRNLPRDTSPGKNPPSSPTRIPITNNNNKNYRNVQAKVNSFSKTKPKVPPKPQVLNNEPNNNKLERKESVNRIRTNSRSRNNGSSTYRVNNNKTENNNPQPKTAENNNNPKPKTAENNNPKPKTEENKTQNSNPTENDNNNPQPKTAENTSEHQPTTEMKKSDSTVKLADLLQPSTTAVVSSTTTTVTQPLKIEAKLTSNDDNNKMTPMVDGRVLSATSVSNAMNKMNDTVVNTQTFNKEHGLTKLSPAATAIINMAQSGNDATKTTTALPNVETTNDVKESNHVINKSGGIVPARVLEQHVQNNMMKLIDPDNFHAMPKNINEKIKEARTVVAHDVKPIRITVKEKPMDVEVQSGNIRFVDSNSNGVNNERPGLPPAHPTATNNDPPPAEEPAKNICSRFFNTCKKKLTFNKKKNPSTTKSTSCFNCCRKKKPDVTINIEAEDNSPKKTCWDRLKCCGKNHRKIGDNNGCFSTAKRKDSWIEQRRDSILSDPPVKQSKCSRVCCKGILRKIFCLECCCKKKKRVEDERISRRASMMSKKKSLTPSVPPEDNTPKIDMSLVEHSSHMKGAIPILPVCLAWFCLVMNCIAPGSGTIFSGLFCLCIGKPRFSQKDGPRPRIGAFIIDLIIGFGQFFTVLFCLVGWGWSIWWGVIMLKIAKKHQKIKILEQNAQEQENNARPPGIHQNHHHRDPERGP